jgi:hypothetical protein
MIWFVGLYNIYAKSMRYLHLDLCCLLSLLFNLTNLVEID